MKDNFKELPHDSLCIEGLAAEFPGLFDGESDVNGGDLVDFIAEQINRQISRNASTAACYQAQVENWKQCEPKAPWFWLVEPEHDGDSCIATVALVSEDGELRIEQRNYGNKEPERVKQKPHLNHAKEGHPAIIRPERANLFSLWIKEVWGNGEPECDHVWRVQANTFTGSSTMVCMRPDCDAEYVREGKEEGHAGT